MAYIVKKKVYGKSYAYEYTTIWDKLKKKYKKNTKYLGKVDEATGKIIPAKKKESSDQITKIVDFGDSFVINEILENSGLSNIINNVFDKYSQNIKALICFQILEGSALKHVQDWFDGNIAQKLFKKVGMSSQNISKILKYMGKESLKDTFIHQYCQKFMSYNSSILIDSTALSSSINTEKNAWGYTTNGIEKNLKSLMLVDKKTKLPFYFRTIEGSIPDVSILKKSVEEIKNLNLKIENTIFDAGFYSDANINYLISENLDFMTRLPKNRILFEEIIENCKDLEKRSNVVIYGKRALFVKQETIELNKKKIYAYIIEDPKKKAREITKKCFELYDEKDKEKELEIKYTGYFVLLSSKEMKKEEVLPNYYVRQQIEQLFGFSKNNNNLLPLRVHGEAQLEGYLLLNFLVLITYILIREKLGGEMTVEEIMLVLRSLKCKLYKNSKKKLILEANKKQKIIFTKLNIKVPK